MKFLIIFLIIFFLFTHEIIISEDYNDGKHFILTTILNILVFNIYIWDSLQKNLIHKVFKKLIQ